MQNDLFDKKPVTPVDIAKANHEIFSEEFLEWLPDNLHVWEEFAAQAMEIGGRGFKHYSSRTIIEFIRHHTAIKENGGGWKINDHNVPYLARLFDLVYPDKAGLFEYRITKKTVKQAEEN